MSKTFQKPKAQNQGMILQPTNGNNAISKSEAQQLIMKKRDQLNMELMQVLEQETTAESLRENQLK